MFNTTFPQYRNRFPNRGTGLKKDHTLTRGLSLAYLMNDFSQNGVDSSGQRNHGSHINVGWKSGLIGPCGEYDGTTSITATSTVPVASRCGSGSNDFTIACIFQSHAITTNQWIFSNWNNGSWSPSHQSWVLYFQNTGALRLILVHSNANLVQLDAARTIAVGETIKIIMSFSSFDGGTNNGVGSLIMNGEKKLTTGYTFNSSGSTTRAEGVQIGGGRNHNFGTSVAYGQYFNGKIQMALLWDRFLSNNEMQSWFNNPYQMVEQENKRRFFVFPPSSTGVSAAITGSVTSATEADIVAGGKTIIITLTNDTWIAAGALNFDLQRQNIINGLTSAQSELLGWNNVVKALQGTAGVVRTSNTVVTITLDAEVTYSITANETITVTVPATALTGGNAVVASPTFTITNIASILFRRTLSDYGTRIGSRQMVG